MDDTQKQEMHKLKEDVTALMEWKRARETQQLTFPLDEDSLNILKDTFLSRKASLLSFTSVSGLEFESLLVSQGRNTYLLSLGQPVYTLTVDTATDIFTIGQDIATGGQGFVSDGQQWLILAASAAPTPLSSGSSYYIVNSDAQGRTFQLSLTFAGAPINITAAGDGVYFQFFT